MKYPFVLLAGAAGMLLVTGCTITLPDMSAREAAPAPQVVEVRREVETVVREPAGDQVVNNYYNETEVINRSPDIVACCPTVRRRAPRVTVRVTPRPRRSLGRTIRRIVRHIAHPPRLPRYNPRPPRPPQPPRGRKGRQRPPRDESQRGRQGPSPNPGRRRQPDDESLRSRGGSEPQPPRTGRTLRAVDETGRPEGSEPPTRLARG